MAVDQAVERQFRECMPLFIAFGDEVRLNIISVLSQAHMEGNHKGLNVNEITMQTNLSRPAISHHLKILKDSGLVGIIQDGTANYYHATLQEGTRQLMNLSFLIQEVMYR